jgi:hypothetical protein
MEVLDSRCADPGSDVGPESIRFPTSCFGQVSHIVLCRVVRTRFPSCNQSVASRRIESDRRCYA